MSKIIALKKGMDVQTKINLLTAVVSEKLSKLSGEKAVKFDAWVITRDVEDSIVMTALKDGKIYGSNSKTFINAFTALAMYSKEGNPTVNIASAKGGNGEFLYCTSAMSQDDLVDVEEVEQHE